MPPIDDHLIEAVDPPEPGPCPTCTGSEPRTIRWLEDGAIICKDCFLRRIDHIWQQAFDHMFTQIVEDY